MPFIAFPYLVQNRIQTRSLITFSCRDSVAFFNLKCFLPPFFIFYDINVLKKKSFIVIESFLFCVWCFLVIKLRFCVLSWNTICMRLCPFQEIVLQLEANGVHLSLAGDVSCDHSCQGVTRFLCNFYIFSLATNQQSGRHFKTLEVSCFSSHFSSVGFIWSSLYYNGWKVMPKMHFKFSSSTSF